MRQLSLIPKKKYHGRKTARAIATKRGQNHVVLKSRYPVLRKHRTTVLRSIRDTQDRFGIRLRAVAVMSTHIHLVVKVSHRDQFANALRMLAGTIARRVARKGKFWLQRAWSRIVKPGRDLDTATMYVLRNPMKAGIWHMGLGRYVLGVRWHFAGLGLELPFGVPRSASCTRLVRAQVRQGMIGFEVMARMPPPWDNVALNQGVTILDFDFEFAVAVPLI